MDTWINEDRKKDDRGVIPSVIVRIDDPEIRILNKRDDEDELEGGKEEVKWTEDSLSILRELVPLLEETEEGIEMRYNFTHLSNVLKVGKLEIYEKLIELYRGGEGGDSVASVASAAC